MWKLLITWRILNVVDLIGNASGRGIIISNINTERCHINMKDLCSSSTNFIASKINLLNQRHL